MSHDIYLGGRKVRVHARNALGKGGEADVFDLGDGRALKLFKTPDHPDLSGVPAEQDAARRRLELQQTKLRAFPAGLPPGVVVPGELATDRTGKRILGYAMAKVEGGEPLFRFSDPGFRACGVPGTRLAAILLDLHSTLRGLHHAGVVVGDLNDRNLLVQGDLVRVIDADSFQFPGYPCAVFTERFVDPRLCDPSAASPLLVLPYDQDADWYAFSVLGMQTLLAVGPHGGVHAPADPARRCPAPQRPMRRITVFDPEVRYPKAAVRFEVLPDPLLQHFHRVFVEDLRGPFPGALLEDLRFSACPGCGTEHARAVCPTCRPGGVRRPATVARVHGEVSIESVMTTRGALLAVSTRGGELAWLVHQDGAFFREDGTRVLAGDPTPGMRFAIQGDTTLVGRDNELLVFRPGKPVDRRIVDLDGRGPAFAAHEAHRVWVHQGRLYRDGGSSLGGLCADLPIGEVLAGQTRVFLGARMGLGLYRAENLSVAFLFDPSRRGLCDGLKLPRLPGELLDVGAALDRDRAWLFLATVCQGRTLHLARVHAADGTLLASAEAVAGDGSWLGGRLDAHAAVGGALLSLTDRGVVRVSVQGGSVGVDREFPDTEPFVHQGSRLVACRRGLAVATPTGITVLRMGRSDPRGGSP